MSRFVVRILPRAETDVAEIAAWLYARSPQGANQWLRALENAIAKLADVADGCGSAPEGQALNRPLQQFLFHTPRGRRYRAVFLRNVRNVEVLRVRGPGQPPLANDEIGMPAR